MEDFIAVQELQHLSNTQTASTSHINLFTIPKSWIPSVENVDFNTETRSSSERMDLQTCPSDVRCQLTLKLEEGESVSCSACEKTFKSLTSLNQHIKSMHNSLAPEKRDDYNFLCNMCGKVYTSKIHLKEHEESVHMQKTFECKFCGKTYKWKSNLGTHIQQTHYVQRPVRKLNIRRQCEECHLQFATNNLLDAHMHEIHGVTFDCKICGRTFILKSQYDMHMLSTHRGLGWKYECEICKRRFKWESGLEKHLERTGHAPAIEVKDIQTGVAKKCFKCKQCKSDSLVFETATLFRDHLKNSHSLLIATKPRTNTINGRTCQVCLKSFPHDKVAYKKHIMSHRECNLCDYKCGAPSDLRKHMRKHTGERPYACEFCGKSFRCISGMRTHERRHTNNYGHTCDLCQKGFYRKQDYVSHMLIHKQQWAIECKFCKKRYKSRAGFESHMKTVHNSESDTPYQCPTCEQRFSTELLFEEHNRGHLNDIICDMCRKGFSTEKDLEDHRMIVHVKDWLQMLKKEHTCSMCSGKFGSTESFALHCLNHLRCSPYECAECNLQLTVKSSFMTHMEVKHPVEFRMLSEEVQKETVTKINLAKKVALKMEKLDEVKPEVKKTKTTSGQRPPKVKAPIKAGENKRKENQKAAESAQDECQLMQVKHKSNQDNLKSGLGTSSKIEGKKAAKAAQGEGQLMEVNLEFNQDNLELEMDQDNLESGEDASESEEDQAESSLQDSNEADELGGLQETKKKIVNAKKKFECRYCDNKYLTVQGLDDHHRDTHQQDLEIYRQCLSLRITQKGGKSGGEDPSNQRLDSILI